MTERQIEFTLAAMAKSQEQLARSLAAESAVVMRMASLLRAVPVEAMRLGTGEPYTDAAQTTAKQITSYLNALAELEESLADNVKAAFKELRAADDE
ncbi:hypothetical protein MO973_06795 [Paenibacillus sp. TRM 82003]|nr:hypothetical protein [Paenibacillus sp. TRM 82003]